MTEHKLSEQEMQEIWEEAEKYIPLGDPMSEYPSYYHEIEIERAYEAGAIATLTRERERVKPVIHSLELLVRACRGEELKWNEIKWAETALNNYNQNKEV